MKMRFPHLESHDELLQWKEKYDREEIAYTGGEEERLGARFRSKRFATKEDLVQIIKWKFQGRLAGRQVRILNLFTRQNEASVKRLTRLAFAAEDDAVKLTFLLQMQGIGTALSSVVLAFYDPQNYGILDSHAWRGLFGSQEPRGLSQSQRHAIHYFMCLRQISDLVKLPCRDIEKAIFKWHLDESKKMI